MKGHPPVHSIALYANPILPKPPTTGEGIRFVTAGTLPATDTNYTTMVFGPGVHDIGALTVHSGKNYYIPGDAILYGSIGNSSDKGNFRCKGDRINIYGYGTICGMKIPHYKYSKNNPEYPEWNEKHNRGGGVGISINEAWDIKITGVTVTDPSTFNSKIDGYHKRNNDQSLMSWAKLHSWRQNGDGNGGYLKMEDSFIRASDDSTYVRTWRTRCTFWKDSNANIFRFINFIGGGLDDCDVLYARWRYPSGVGSIFEFASNSTTKNKMVPNKIVIKNIRFHDKLSNPKRVIHMASADIFTGITFENITFYPTLNKHKSEIMGFKEAPYSGSGMFKNIQFQQSDGKAVKLTQSNYKNYFDVNEFVNEKLFEEAAP